MPCPRRAAVIWPPALHSAVHLPREALRSCSCSIPIGLSAARLSSSRPIRNAPLKPCAASGVSWRGIWATACLSPLATPKPMRMTPSGAVRAGLELIAAVIALKTPASLQTRVGIATGLVVVGDLSGSGEAQERAIVGETPNLAARLQGIAEPNTVVIAEATRRLLGNLFELRD